MHYSADFARTDEDESHQHVIRKTSPLGEVLKVCGGLTGKDVSVYDGHGRRIAVGVVDVVSMKDQEGVVWNKKITLRFKEGHELEIAPPVVVVIGDVEEDNDNDTDWFGG